MNRKVLFAQIDFVLDMLVNYFRVMFIKKSNKNTCKKM